MTISLEALAAVYLAFAIKHLLGDYLLQTAWMAVGKGQVTGWQRPLAAHAAIHAAGTLLIALAVAPGLWWLGLVDLALHAAIDRVKSNTARGWTMTQPRFWWAFGLDQFAHQITHFGFLLVLVTAP